MADTSPIDALRARLAARQSRPGFRANAEAIAQTIDQAEGAGFVHRDAATGRFVSPDYFAANRATTYRTKIRR